MEYKAEIAFFNESSDMPCIRERMLEQVIYSKNGTFVKKEVYDEEGLPTGKTLFQDVSGKQLGTCKFDLGQANGKYFEFDNESNIIAEHNMAKGHRTKQSIYYYPGGGQKKVISYDDG